jgi:DnaJ-class molecular chaperone
VGGVGRQRERAQRGVRGAYGALAQKHHPEKGGEQAEFELIKSAYDAGMEAR